MHRPASRVAVRQGRTEVPEALAGLTALLAPGQVVRISGYEIERFLDFSSGGGFWSDGSDNGTTGQVSLWVTDVCVE
jgi:hypothetical protein